MTCTVVRLNMGGVLNGKSTLAQAIVRGMRADGIEAVLILPSQGHVCNVGRRHRDLQPALISARSGLDGCLRHATCFVVDDVLACHLNSERLNDLVNLLSKRPVPTQLVLIYG